MSEPLSPTMLDMLRLLRHCNVRCDDVWYHDFGQSKQMSNVLLARGFVTDNYLGYLLLTDKGRAALTEDEGPDVKAIELIKRLAFGRPISGRLARQYAREFLAEIGIKGE